MNLPVEVIEAVRAKRCLVFLGSRATYEAAELKDEVFPDNNTVAKDLGWKKPKVPLGGKNKVVIPSVEDASGAFEAAKGRPALIEELRGKIGGAGLVPSSAHVAIVKRFPTVITTCQDSLLEQAAREAGIAVDVVKRGTKIPDPEAGRLTVVKLRGSFDDPDTLMLTGADYTRAALSVDARKQLRTMIRNNVCFFVGFRPDEEEFEHLWAELSDAYGGELPRCHLAVAQGPIDDYLWQKWVWRGLLMFTADATECLRELEERTA